MDNLLFVLGSAVRYGLGRKSYAPSLIVDVIKDNLSLFNEKWVINLLRDLYGYERDRVTWEYKDDSNVEYWAELKRVLLAVYKERGYTRPIE